MICASLHCDTENSGDSHAQSGTLIGHNSLEDAGLQLGFPVLVDLLPAESSALRDGKLKSEHLDQLSVRGPLL